MIRMFASLIAGLRYLFVLAVLALAILALGSLAVGIVRLADLAVTGGFVMEPGTGAAVVPYFIRAAFLYFLAVALGSLFVGDIPAPQWMLVKNLFQLRTKVLTFVSIILPLAFMGKMVASDTATADVLYSGAGVFLVLMGIYFLIRFGSPAGDEGMAREGNRVPDAGPKGERGQERRPQDSRGRVDRRPAGRPESRTDQDEWLKKQKEDLKFQKESLERAVERDLSGEPGERQGSNVTVKAGPRRPRRRR
jgi:hypothetical protein